MTPRPVLVLSLALVLAACGEEPAAPPPQDLAPTAAPSEPKKSIFRPEFQVETAEEAPLPALEARVFFPEGTALDAKAIAVLEGVIAAPQAKGAGAIVLGGHSDAGGTDAANLRASQARAEAVRDWLIDKGIAADRIVLVAFGEQNPVAPNARPDGSPNEDGRAANRRVEIRIASERPPAPERPTLAEELAAPVGEPVVTGAKK